MVVHYSWGGRDVDGKVQVASYNYGKTKNGNTFEHAYAGFKPNVMKPWTTFVRNLEGETQNLPVQIAETNTVNSEVHTSSTLFQGLPELPTSRRERRPSQRVETRVNTSSTLFQGLPELPPSHREKTPSQQDLPVTNPSTLLNEPLSPRNSPSPEDARTGTPQPQPRNSSPADDTRVGGAQPRNSPPPEDILVGEAQTRRSPLPAGPPPPKDTSVDVGAAPTARTALANLSPQASLLRHPGYAEEPTWFTEALTRLRRVTGADWEVAIELWASIERQEKFGGYKPSRFGTDNRPPQVARWFSYGRLYTSDPPIPELVEYESAVQAWWNFLQPTWRTSTDLLPLPIYSPPPGSDWGELKMSGPNGLLLIMMLFAWWRTAIGPSGAVSSWLAAIADLRQALQSMHDETANAPPLGEPRYRCHFSLTNSPLELRKSAPAQPRKT
ncbi:hypothetical protein IMY05_C3416000300 [Salix suchowensis]|nr:hypothetical protein IMY05_C3416000300 [Salix suchowensis]